VFKFKGEDNMKYAERQRLHHVSLIKTTDMFRNDAAGAEYAGIPRDFILQDGRYNLYGGMADEVTEYFNANKIGWWTLEQGSGKPSGHVLSSQIACLNHLFPIRKCKESVVRLLQTIDADFCDVLPAECDTPQTRGYIAFEAVCAGDYLNENKLTRGTNCTSVDALIAGVKTDGGVVLVAVEWKYTECYSVNASSDKSRGNSGEVRRRRYDGLIAESAFLKPANPVYYYEPFYQLMRQTLFGEHMVKNGYMGSGGFINIHVVPENNAELLKNGGKGYIINGRHGSLTQIWVQQLRFPHLYMTVTPTNLYANQSDGDLRRYLETRYWT
jgi:hypothetical protein